MTLSENASVEEKYVLLRKENLALRKAIRKIEDRLACIESSLPRQRVVVLREISRQQAKKEIKDLFAKGKTVYYSDIADELRLDLQTVVEVCNELQNQGEIEVVGDLL
jgi:DNA invertase Pin-like site-specific DNA recombinase